MAERVGRIELLIDANGDSLPGQVRRHGRRAGAEAGEEFNKGFEGEHAKLGKEAQKTGIKQGRVTGKSMGQAMRDSFRGDASKMQRDVADIFKDDSGIRKYLTKIGNVGEGSKDLQRKLMGLRNAGGLTSVEFGQLTTQLRGVVGQMLPLQKEADRTRKEMDDLGDGLRVNLNRRLVESAEESETMRRALNKIDFDRISDQLDRLREARGLWGQLGPSAPDIRRFGNFSLNVDKLRHGLDELSAASPRAGRALTAIGTRADAARTRVQAFRTEAGVKLRRTLDDAALPLRRLATRIDESADRGNRFTMRLREMGSGLQSFRTRAVEASVGIRNMVTSLSRVQPTADGGERALRRMGNAAGNVTNNLRQMPYILKTIAGYTALFTALAPGIAVLGSVTGSGALALSTGVGALALGIVTLIPAFKGMLDDVGKLPAKARPAAQALQDMAGPLSDLQDTIQEGVFDGLGPAITRLSSKIFPRLERGFGKTAKTINGLFQDLIRNLTSKSALKRFDTIFDGLQPILQKLGRAVIHLGGAFVKLFEAALPSGIGFFTFLNEAFADFSAWLSDDAGRKALTAFFDHLGEIMPGIGRLIGAAGRSLSSLVTEDAVSNMAEFLDVMTGALPEIVGGLGALVDGLDPLGLAAKALSGLGSLLERNRDGFKQLGRGVADFLKSGADLLGPILGGIVDQIVRIAPGIFEDLSDGLKGLNTPELQAAVKETLPKLGDALTAAGEAVSALLKALGKSDVISSAIGTMGDAADVATPLLKGLAAALDLLSGDVKGANAAIGGIDFSKLYELGPKLASLNGMTKIPLDLGKAIGIWLVDATNSAAKALTEFFVKLATKVTTGITTFVADIGKSISVVKSIVGALIGRLFGFGGGGDDGGDAGKKAGEKAVGDAEDGAKLKVLSIVPLGGTIISKLLEGLGSIDVKSLIGAPFTGISEFIGGFFNGLPGIVGRVMDLLPGQGQKGANGVKNPFQPVGTAIGILLNPIPSIIGGIMGRVTGKKGADNTSTPFSTVLGKISGFLTGVPGWISSKIAEASGKKGASNTSSPFSGVKGVIRGFVSGIPSVVTSALANVSGAAAANRIVSAFQGVGSRVAAALGGLAGIVNAKLGAAQGALAGGLAKLNVPKTATGGAFAGAQMRIIAEAGPEAVVPLNRPLSQVDPSVRALSAIAQGKYAVPQGDSKPSKSVVIEDGAFRVMVPNTDPENAARALFDRIIEEF